MIEYVDDVNFFLYAAKHYENHQCYSEEEFREDLDRFKYLKRLLNRYVETGDLKERLILNHLIPLYNVFPPHACTKMLFWKLRGFEKELAPFLILLGYLPDIVQGVGAKGKDIFTSDITLDPRIIAVLRKI